MKKAAAAAVVVVPMEKMDAVASLREIVGCGCCCFAGMMFSAEANSVQSKAVTKAVKDLIFDI